MRYAGPTGRSIDEVPPSALEGEGKLHERCESPPGLLWSVREARQWIPESAQVANVNEYTFVPLWGPFPAREIFRVVRALQRHEQTGRCTPANWKEGEPDLVRATAAVGGGA